MKKVLIVTYKPLLPIDGGDKFRMFNMARVMGDRYQLDIVSPGNLETYDLLKDTSIFGSILLYKISVFSIFFEMCRNIYLGRPLQMAFFETRQSRRTITRIALDYDIIYCHLFRGMMMVPEQFHEKVVWDMCDSVANASALIKTPKNIKQLLFKLDYRKIYHLERSFVKTIPETIVININDLKGIGLCADLVHVVNNGHSGCIVKKREGFRVKGKWLLFIGNMNTYPNSASLNWFIKNILLVSSTDLKLLVVGKGSTYYMKKYDRVYALESYRYLSDIMDRDFIGGVAPMIFGTGVQNKVLDYFALGIPAIISPIAKDGLSIQHGEEVIVCDSVDEYRDAIKAILEQDYDVEKLTNKAGAYLDSNHSWQSVGTKLVSIIDSRFL